MSVERGKHILSTQRLSLRELVHDDLDALHAVLGDPESMAHYPQPFDRDRVIEWINWCHTSYLNRGHGLWAMTLAETGELIGDCGLMVQFVEGVGEIEIGYHVLRARQGRGYASEAARACRDWAFEHLDCPRVISLIRPANTPSAAVARNNGMTIDKRIIWRKREHDVHAITREQLEAKGHR